MELFLCSLSGRSYTKGSPIAENQVQTLRQEVLHYDPYVSIEVSLPIYYMNTSKVFAVFRDDDQG